MLKKKRDIILSLWPRGLYKYLDYVLKYVFRFMLEKLKVAIKVWNKTHVHLEHNVVLGVQECGVLWMSTGRAFPRKNTN